jgi:lysophospholipase L1-like esterase
VKNILCFGDSNTFASHPLGGRHPYDVRWTGRLQALLGAEYRVIEEGLGGRTTVFDDQISPGRNGRTALPMAIGTHNPLDLIIVMLGTNDLKEQYHVTTWDLARAMEQLMHIIDAYEYAPHYQKPQVLLVAPIEVGEDIENSPFGCFTRAAIAPSKAFASIYAPVAERYGAHFFDAASVARPSAEDQLHMDESSHRALADALAVKVREILA